MNSLSWLIYAGDLLEKAATFIAVIGIGSIVGAGVMMAWCFMSADFRKIDLRYPLGEDTKVISEDIAGKYRLAKVAGIAGVCIALLAGSISVVIPSKSTVYMIAASEMGEKVVTTPEAKEMLGDLREVIAKQIKKLKDDK